MTRASRLTSWVQGGVQHIHGEDVARAIYAVHSQPDKSAGQRWLVGDKRHYDLWDLACALGHPGVNVIDNRVIVRKQEQERPIVSQWVQELMVEDGVITLPRPAERLGRRFDTRDFWSTFDLEPVRPRIEIDRSLRPLEVSL
jgi:nucleoside-diphosphate-sugar epimerase